MAMRARLLTAMGAACLLVTGAPTSGLESGENAAPIEKLKAWARQPPVRHRAVRRLSAHKEGSTECAWLHATTTFDPRTGMTFRIDEEGGPRLLRRRMRQILEQERRAYGHDASRPPASWAITEDNYDLDVEEPRGATVVVRLTPRRRDPWLLEGSALLTSGGEVTRVEGRAVEPPSFWLRDVSVVRMYTRVGSRTMLTAVTSAAQVRWFGSYRFAMVYDYQTVDGQAMARAHGRFGSETSPSPMEKLVPTVTPRCGPE